MEKSKYTPLEVASALRKAGEWLLSPTIRIRGRRLGRSPGNIVTSSRLDNEPTAVCLIGAAWYELNDPAFHDDTDACLQTLSMGNVAAHRFLEEAYQEFDAFVESGGKRTNEGKEHLKHALKAVNAAALEVEKMIETNAKERARKREKAKA